ncbi:Bug family tripartite tricarboxylate transporter substrate binding protein [Agromyces archimandritae]|uniref:Tripartite tricarboxylate transporter substrate binding protein n=1 Tax=Agromyces archimandritae TaxID=2781962 RepID=A0A975FMA2_9MICO|nr:tripartite tricarboxylate transporter substrate binding protein [Agromyces archimandritae]QTX04526.1 tripartite tricarboxylate transporter substrate binding protein [Agromyces archimandritae]
MKIKALAVLGLAAVSAVVLTGCGGNVGAAAGSSDDAAFPTRDITLTVGQDAGGSTDLIARAVAAGMEEELGVAVPVVNKAGANGAVATAEVAGMDPDGYNLVLLNASLITITNLTLGEAEQVELDDLTVLKGLSQDDYVLVASKASGIESFDDLTVVDKLSYGTTGVGTGSQLAQAILFGEAGVAGTDVPFDSGSPALTAVMGDQVQVATIQLGEAKPQIDAGTVTPLVVFSAERNPFLEDVPTATELGYDVPVSQFRAVAAPAGLPQDIEDALVAAIDAALASKEYQAFNENNLLTPHEISGDDVVAEWNGLLEKYAGLVEDNGISLTD